MKMKLRKYKNNNHLNFLVILIIIIILLTIYLFNIYTMKVSPKLVNITKFNLDRFTNKAILSKFDDYIISEYDINNLIEFSKNSSGEIIGINYDLSKAYELLGEWLREIHNDVFELNALEFKHYDKDFSASNNSFIVSYPLGLATNNMFLNNLGPRIPVRINLLSNVITNINTKVKNYGINSLLIEMTVQLDIAHEIIALEIEEFTFKYEVLIASKIVQGKIPSYLGGMIEKNSGTLS